MRTFLTLLTLLALTLAQIVAGTAFAHGDSGFGSSIMGHGSMMDNNDTMGPGMMDEYSDEQWNRFDRSFRDMNQLMEQIHRSEDPDERDRLMHDHMHELQNGMVMMGESWGTVAPHNSGNTNDWERRMQIMEKQMFLMQHMLSQMIERESAVYDEDAE